MATYLAFDVVSGGRSAGTGRLELAGDPKDAQLQLIELLHTMSPPRLTLIAPGGSKVANDDVSEIRILAGDEVRFSFRPVVGGWESVDHIAGSRWVEPGSANATRLDGLRGAPAAPGVPVAPVDAFAQVAIDATHSLVLGSLQRNQDGTYRRDSVSGWMQRETSPGGAVSMSAISLDDAIQRWPQLGEELLSATRQFIDWARNHEDLASADLLVATDPRMTVAGARNDPALRAAILGERALRTQYRDDTSVRSVVAEQDDYGRWGVRVTLRRGSRPPRGRLAIAGVPVAFDNGHHVWARNGWIGDGPGMGLTG